MKNSLIVAFIVAALCAQTVEAIGLVKKVPAAIKARYANVLSTECNGAQEGLPYLDSDQSSAYSRAVRDLTPYYGRETAQCYALRYAEGVN